jgi:hypothetical protein
MIQIVRVCSQDNPWDSSNYVGVSHALFHLLSGAESRNQTYLELFQDGQLFGHAVDDSGQWNRTGLAKPPETLLGMLWEEASTHFGSFKNSFTVYNGVDDLICIVFAVENNGIDAFWEGYIEDNIVVFRKVVLSLGSAECVSPRFYGV